MLLVASEVASAILSLCRWLGWRPGSRCCAPVARPEPFSRRARSARLPSVFSCASLLTIYIYIFWNRETAWLYGSPPFKASASASPAAIEAETLEADPICSGGAMRSPFGFAFCGCALFQVQVNCREAVADAEAWMSCLPDQAGCSTAAVSAP